MRPPHVILFCCDHYRGDVLGHAGNHAAVTPRLDAMVQSDAASFTRAYCQNGVCTPSRCSFLTGYYPHTRGHRTMHRMLEPDEPCLLRTLKDAGYFVWWAGKNDVVPADRDPAPYCDVRFAGTGKPTRAYGARDTMHEWRGEPGDDRYYAFFAGCLDHLDPQGNNVGHYHDHDWDNIEGAIDLLHNPPAAVTDGKPLCLYLALSMPDTPYGVEEPWYSMIDRAALPPRIEAGAGKPAMLERVAERYNLAGWSDDQWRELRAAYYGKCARADHLLGMLVDALHETGMYDDTTIVFFSDHGDYTGDFGMVDINQNTFDEPLSRVPLVIKPPKGVELEPGPRNALVELTDLPATIHDLVGVDADYTHFGRSLRRALAARGAAHRDAVFAEGGRLRGERHCMELESVEAHKPESPYWPRVGLQADEGSIDDSIVPHGKAVMCRTDDFKYVYRLYETDEFYDLQRDPGEQFNAIHDPAFAEDIQRHRDRMLKWFVETGDIVRWQADRRH